MDDIHAENCNDPTNVSSEIVSFFSGSTVFITGATGFLGRLLTEKLLRACFDIKRIYVVIRPKKEKNMQERLEEIFDEPCFELLKRKHRNRFSKVVCIAGDFGQPDMGISETDKETLIKEVDCIIHCAATVRFDQKLSAAVNINVKGTRDLIAMAKQMKNLRAMLHVSTAFAYCFNKRIDEVFYESPMDASKLITLTEILEDEKLDQITPKILGCYPNTYVFTKAVAECLVRDQANNLPIAVFRPSMIISTAKEPIAGWINNFYGPTGMMVSASVGLTKSIYGNPDFNADMVPADYVVNCALAIMWEISKTKSINNRTKIETEESKEEIPIYNFVSSAENKVFTWGETIHQGAINTVEIPTVHLVWYAFYAIRLNKWKHLLACFFYQTIPAYLTDFLAICLGKEPRMVKAYQKIEKFSNVLTYFITRDWSYSNQNVQNLWKKLNQRDRELFEFSMKNFDWKGYFYHYVRGARVYLLKDPLETVPEGKKRYIKLMILHYTLLTVLALIGIKLLLFTFGLFF